MIDEFCSVQVGGQRKRGRLISLSDTELVLFLPNNVQERYTVSDVNVRSKTALLADGSPLRWSKVCSCGQPASLKGPRQKFLEMVA